MILNMSAHVKKPDRDHNIDLAMRCRIRFLVASCLLLVVTAKVSFAQDQCALTLNEAEDRYEQGRLYEIPEMIQ